MFGMTQMTDALQKCLAGHFQAEMGILHFYIAGHSGKIFVSSTKKEWP